MGFDPGMQLTVPHNGIAARASLPHLLVARVVHDLLEELVEHVLLGRRAAVARPPHVHVVPEMRGILKCLDIEACLPTFTMVR